MSDSPAVAPAARGRVHLQQRLSSVRTYIEAHPYVAVFLLALVVRLLLIFVFSSYFSARGFVLDDATYNDMATDMASGDISHWDAFTYSLYWRTAAFLGPVTVIYKVFGPVKPFGQVFVAVLGSGAAALLVRVASEVMQRRWAVAAGVTIALFPSQVFWSSMLLKDAAVWIVLVGLSVAVAIAGRSGGKKLVASVAAVALLLGTLAFLREHTLVVAAWAVMISSLFGSRIQRVQRIAAAVAVGVAIPWAVAAAGPAGLAFVMNAGSLTERRFHNAFGAETAVVPTADAEKLTAASEELALLDAEAKQITAKLEQLGTAESGAAAGGGELSGESEPSAGREGRAGLRERRERLRERRERLRKRLEQIERRETALTQDVTEATMPPPQPPDSGLLDPNVRHLPRGLAVMLLEPFPVPFEGSLSLRLARLESLLWYPLLLFAALGLWHARQHLRVFAFPVLVGGGIAVMYALAEGNIGTAHRHRGEFVWVIALLAVFGTARVISTIRARRG